ncbi:MAG: hypothetical protein AAF762_14450, partial [Pseudomonadota bacterium]
ASGWSSIFAPGDCTLAQSAMRLTDKQAIRQRRGRFCPVLDANPCNLIKKRLTYPHLHRFLRNGDAIALLKFERQAFDNVQQFAPVNGAAAVRTFSTLGVKS